MTLQQRLAAARDHLVAAGITAADASIDVDLYARTILGWDRARLIAAQRDAAPETLEPRFSEWMTRRARHEPTAYIVGSREFWGLDLLVTPAVLIPRPETEFIVEEALAIARAGGLKASGERPRALRLADVGTGSGCLAVALTHELQDIRMVATDISGEALAVARQNAERHSVADRIEFQCTSYLDGVDGPFDMIVSNPPYVRQGDKPALARDVRHEPDVALFGGGDGLAHLAGVLDAVIPRLSTGGWFLMEFGYGQEDDVRALVGSHREFRLERIRDDLQGIARTAIMQRR